MRNLTEADLEALAKLVRQIVRQELDRLEKIKATHGGLGRGGAGSQQA